jgi:hypothetical protein
VHKLSNKILEVDDSTIIFQLHLGGCVAALADGQAEGHTYCATKVAPPPRQCLLARRPMAEFLVSWHGSRDRARDAITALSVA